MGINPVTLVKTMAELVSKAQDLAKQYLGIMEKRIDREMHADTSAANMDEGKTARVTVRAKRDVAIAAIGLEQRKLEVQHAEVQSAQHERMLQAQLEERTRVGKEIDMLREKSKDSATQSAVKKLTQIGEREQRVKAHIASAMEHDKKEGHK